MTTSEHSLTLTIALVAREGGANVVEYSVEGDQGAPMPNVTMRQVLPAGSTLGDAPLSAAAQVAGNPPMEQPPEAALPIGGTAKMDAASWVADERVTTSGGTFAASHFRRLDADGAAVEMWLSRAAPPIGLVRLRQTSSGGEVSTTELRRLGAGAAPKIVAAPVPFNQDVMVRQMMASMKKM
jgi:hypothetical protein